MSWDHYRYEAICKQCNHIGVRIESSNDWNERETTWEGFNTKPADPYLVGRRRVDEMMPVCHCGSTDIEVGKSLGD